MAWSSAKTIFEIIFAQPFRPLNGKRELVEFLSNGQQTIPDTEHIRIQDEQQRLTVFTSAQRLNIAAETGEYTKDIRLILATYKRINEKFHLPTYARLGLRRFTYLEKDDFSKYESYNDFVQAFKSSYTNQSALISSSDDVAISLLFDKQIKTNLNLGPMENDEIEKKYLEYKPKIDFPDYYLMLDIDNLDARAGSLTNAAIKRFIDSTESIFKEHSKVVEKEWKDG